MAAVMWGDLQQVEHKNSGINEETTVLSFHLIVFRIFSVQVLIYLFEIGFHLNHPKECS